MKLSADEVALGVTLSGRQLGLVAIAMRLACVASPVAFPKNADGIRTLTDTVYYTVYGTTPTQWMTSARVEAARAGIRVPSVALTAGANRWTYSARPSEFGCEPHDVVVILGLRFVMPRLATESGVTADDLAAWQGFVRYVWVHEKSHAAIAMRSAIEFRDSLRVLHAGECGLLTSHVESVAGGVRERSRVLQDALDARARTGGHAAGQIRVFRGSVLAVDTTFRDSVP